ncbi:tRNA pseudouridine synthase A [Clostridium novyi B str. ATCC 27606]|uniref:tRNA pseudouridine synthase A n=2 Tax=Clostridium TaxID=1485 RepID=A0AA40IVD8_CLONO|nr:MULTISPECIES: tRNA pseudouridine(38-40) synthase TruA [Clostridium]KEI13972.1 tRNA pseudouridine synthase A [Clostridium novyi B str. NCTC 9691]KEI17845.1 tRNA pseudouridine synthase A [Clostridium haemolyticum NCTC 9693]KEI17913.1 tRNA pseudouridine synthase A [Clostridium novyi B str. ATCC 27606]KGN03810.1 tRNA pseudouridine synthase A [Clostridium haemolyticum NCTC 8350]CAG7840623.1 tRNA pseudouridine synthase A [Clostridium haemolyticum]
MRNIKLTIQYDGTRYKGWQKLGNTDNTIQYKIESVLNELLGEEVSLIASGRTDAGVHANMQIANFKTNSNVTNYTILKHCYKYLPQDIVVTNISDASENFHSRYNVKKKIYTYNIYNNPVHDVFTRKYSYHIKETLDIKKMKEASKLFIGEHDFRSFTALKSKKKSTIKTIDSITFKKKDNNIEIIFTGNGFLYKMIRILVGSLINIGLGKLTIEDLQNIMNKKDRSIAPETAPAHGLILTEVKY